MNVNITPKVSNGQKIGQIVRPTEPTAQSGAVAEPSEEKDFASLFARRWEAEYVSC